MVLRKQRFVYNYGGDYETIEIIGNIWENPELLEQANEN
ncbi:YopX family protein [Enterococcus faecium]